MKVEGYGLHKLVESRGHSGKRRAPAELHHIRVYAGEGATHENPAWTVHHYASAEDDEPQKVHSFDSHRELMNHLDRHTSPELNEESEA